MPIAFRGFGGPQGILLIEDVFGQCAPALGIDPAELRRRNFYEPGQTTPYGQLVKDAERMPAIWSQVLDSCEFERRSAEVTPAVCKASAGAVEHVAIARVKNLADFLQQAKDKGCWVYGAAALPLSGAAYAVLKDRWSRRPAIR